MRVPDWTPGFKAIVRQVAEDSGIERLPSWLKMINQASSSYVAFGFHINQPCEGCGRCFDGYRYAFDCKDAVCKHPQSCPVRKTRCFGEFT